VVEALPVEVPLPVLVVLPAVPFEVSPGARLVATPLAAVWYASRVLLVAVFSLMTIDMPFWQCFPCEQYSHMGVVLLIMIVYVGVMESEAETGMNPEKTPVTLEVEPIGWHGAANVDCVTVWFAGANWNCTISPTAATMLFGEYTRVAFAFPTFTT